MTRRRLAIIATHPIQYYAPWFRSIATRADIELRVFYLWDFGTSARHDPGFDRTVTWDVDLLGGYAHEFVGNWSPRPGTRHFLGLLNPGLGRRLRRFAPDALLLMSYSHASTLWTAITASTRLLFRGDSHVLAGVPGGWRTAFKRWLFRRFAAVLHVGSANREYWFAHGVPSSRLYFSPHAIDLARFSATDSAFRRMADAQRKALGIGDALVALFVGKFEHKKRPVELVRAFLSRAPAHAHLVLVGSGALESRIREVIAGSPRVHLAGFRNQSEMPVMYAMADLLVLPSAGPHETWGLAVSEAMAAGRPALVSSHVGCHPDLVEDGGTGWVFAADDWQDCARLLEYALADRERLQRMGEAARHRVLRYSFDAATDGLVRALDGEEAGGCASSTSSPR